MVPVSRIFPSSCCRLLQCLLKPRVTVQSALLLWGLTSRAGSFTCFLLLEVSSDASPCLLVENLLLPIIMKEFIQNLLEVLINLCYQEFPSVSRNPGCFSSTIILWLAATLQAPVASKLFPVLSLRFSSGCVPEPQPTEKPPQNILTLLSSKASNFLPTHWIVKAQKVNGYAINYAN